MYNHYCQHCNKQLEVSLHYKPCYDDGGGLDSFDVEECINDCDCEGAPKAMRSVQPIKPPQNHDNPSHDDDPFHGIDEPSYDGHDDLPF